MDSTNNSSHASEPPALVRRTLLKGMMVAALPGATTTNAIAASPPALASREIPARTLPVPSTVSPELQALIAGPYPVGWDQIPPTAAAWKQLATLSAQAAAPFLAEIRRQFNLHVEAAEIAGVKIFTVTPADMPPANRDTLLLHVHGGGYVFYPGEAGAGEGMLMAGHGGYKVISVDYRMAPDFPFPAALDDAMAIWRELLKTNDPRRMAIFGASSGGGLTLAMLLRAKAEGLPMPAVIAPGTPWVDLTGAGDSIMANAFVDNVLVSNAGWANAAAALYAAGHDLRDPLISPIYGDFTGLPPAILTSGTRDLFLSNTVRTQRKLLDAGVDARLQVMEGQSHAQFLDPFLPETTQAFREIVRILRMHLAA